MVYDAIMVNSYKALNFMALGDWNNARVELNRAGDRQRRATEFFASEIAEQEKRLSKESQSSPADMRAAVDNANAALESTYTALAAWSAYPDFINPLANWLHGWHLMVAPQTSGDWSRAAELFGSVVGMLPENPVAAADQDWANRLADGAVRP